MVVSAQFGGTDATVWAANNTVDAVRYVTLTAADPIVLLKSDATTAVYSAGDTENDDVVDSVVIKFTIAASNGAITINQTYGANGDEIKYAIRSAGDVEETQASVESIAHSTGKLSLSEVRTTEVAA